MYLPFATWMPILFPPEKPLFSLLRIATTVGYSQGKRTSANCLIINSSLLFSKLI